MIKPDSTSNKNKMLTTAQLQALQQITSVARLSSYKHSLGTSTPAETFGAYMWSTAVSSAFAPLVQAIEISFRNALNNALTAAYGADWFEHWVTQAAQQLRSAGRLRGQSEGERRIAQAKDKIREKDRSERNRKGQGSLPAGYTPSWQAVLAEMTFGFWVNFLTKAFWDINTQSKLWPKHLTVVFPHAPSRLYAQGALHKEFKAVVDLRNRIHHQEPLWKHHSVANSTQALAFLQQQRVAWLSPDKLTALQRYGVIAALDELCSASSYQRFIGQSQGHTVCIDAARQHLPTLPQQIRPDQSIWLTSDSNEPCLVLKSAARRFF